jgi:HK97 family phage portal protein
MGIRDAVRALVAPHVEQKASAAGPLIALHHVGQPVWTPRRYDQLAEEGYRKNVIAFRCVAMTARAAAQVPWLLFRGGQALAEHPLLALLERPNPTQGGAALFEALYAFFLIAGNSFLEEVGPDDGAPRELWVLRPDRTKVIPGDEGLPVGYLYDVAGRQRRFETDPVTGRAPVLHLKAFHPLNDWYGMSAIEAAAFAIDQHNAAGAWNKALLDNGARPSGALVYAPKEGPGNLSESQFERLQSQIEERFARPANACKPLLLDGGLDWREMSLSPKDMDWIAGKDVSAREIAQAYGVPPQLVGIPDSQTFNNVREARLAFYDDAVLPLLDQAQDALNGWLAPRFGEGLRLAFDEDAIEALTLRRERKWAAVRDADFLTLNEKRAELGFGPIDGGDAMPTPARARRRASTGIEPPEKGDAP